MKFGLQGNCKDHRGIMEEKSQALLAKTQGTESKED